MSENRDGMHFCHCSSDGVCAEAQLVEDRDVQPIVDTGEELQAAYKANYQLREENKKWREELVEFQRVQRELAEAKCEASQAKIEIKKLQEKLGKKKKKIPMFWLMALILAAAGLEVGGINYFSKNYVRRDIAIASTEVKMPLPPPTVNVEKAVMACTKKMGGKEKECRERIQMLANECPKWNNVSR